MYPEHPVDPVQMLLAFLAARSAGHAGADVPAAQLVESVLDRFPSAFVERLGYICGFHLDSAATLIEHILADRVIVSVTILPEDHDGSAQVECAFGRLP